MKYNFDKIVPRRHSHCDKHDNCQTIFGRADVIPLWIADMDFEIAPFIEAAMRRRMEHPVYGYAFRSDSYYNSAINWVKRHNGWDIRKEWVDFTPGVVSGFVFGIRAFSKEGEGVVIMPPVYPPFSNMIRANGRKVINNPLKLTEDGYRIDFEDLDNKLKDARILLFCNPHNPTGRVFTVEELEKVGQLCVKHDVAIISDEIHSDLIHPPHKHIHIASLSKEIADRTVTFIAPSKTFNLAGLSVSLAVTPGEKFREIFQAELAKVHVVQGNVFGTAALEAAYNEGDEWLAQFLEYIQGTMDLVMDFLNKNLPSVKTHRSEGTYLMWMDFREWGLKHEDLMHKLVHEAGLGFNDGILFGDEGSGFMRMNLATSREVIGEVLERLVKVAPKK